MLEPHILKTGWRWSYVDPCHSLPAELLSALSSAMEAQGHVTSLLTAMVPAPAPIAPASSGWKKPTRPHPTRAHPTPPCVALQGVGTCHSDGQGGVVDGESLSLCPVPHLAPDARGDATISRTQSPSQIAVGSLGGVADSTQSWWHWPFLAPLEEGLG